MQAFYYGTWLLQLISLFSLLAVYNSNKRVIRDLKNLPMVKDKWLQAFLQEHQSIVNENGGIHNPAVYLTRRMRGRKIGPVSLRKIKGISWFAFALSFLCGGTGLFLLRRTGLASVSFPIIDRAFQSQLLLAATLVGGGAILLLIRALLSMGYQEEVLETNLLDFMENQKLDIGKVVIVDMKKQKKLMNKPKTKKNRARATPKKLFFKKREQKRQAQNLQEQKLLLQKERASKEAADKEQEQVVRKAEERIREAAATDERYSHLLNKEEEAIVKDVIKEFLS